MDRSIIDITGQSFSISDSSKPKVPYWRHQYVYSFSEIETANKDQRRFYKTFKSNFLNETFMDIDDNTNYAFILLFDFLNEYESHKNVDLLETRLKQLGRNYPRTKTYCVSFLIKKLDEDGKTSDVERIRKEENYYVYDSSYWKLGNIYKTKLNLTDEEILLLNKLYAPNNNFFNIEFCGREILRLYLVVVKRLDEKYQKESTSIENQLNMVADSLVSKNFNYRRGSNNYNYYLETIVNELHSNILKFCENTVREQFSHKRKLNTEVAHISTALNNEHYIEFLNRLQKILAIYSPIVSIPDRDVELELNAQNPTRWKVKYEQLISSYDGDHKQFVSNVVILGNHNKKNPSVSNIFFEASKFIASHDKISSLKLYIYYLHYDLRSVKFGNKPLAKTVQKSLFSTNEQLHDFQILVSEMIKDKELDKALNSVPKVYAVKRKKIHLDMDTIQQVHEKHSDTVELLNEYLKDEYEDDANTFKIEEISEKEVVLEITPKSDLERTPTLNTEIHLTDIQCELLELLAKANLSIHQDELDAFAKSKGVFKNQLIDSLNEACYDTLDDILIEEEEDYYTINDNYYQTILAK